MSYPQLSALRVSALLLAAINAQPVVCWAITANQVDTFPTAPTPPNPANITHTQGWGYASPVSPVGIVTNGGASGTVGDHALLMDVNNYGNGRLVVLNQAQWTGNWTAAGIARVSMDVKNTNIFTLSMRLGITGLGGIDGGGGGDNHITKTVIPVPADNAWHTITFDVLASDFTFVNDTHQNTAFALANVIQFRIFRTHQLGDYSGNGVVDIEDYVFWRNTVNTSVPPGTGADGSGPEAEPDGVVDAFDYGFWKLLYGEAIHEFIGTQGMGKFQLDNIRGLPASAGGAGSSSIATAVPEPASWLFMAGLFVFAWVAVRRRV